MAKISQLLHQTYCSAHRSQRSRKRGLTETGKIIFGGIVLAAILGLDMNRTHIYQLFALLSAFFLLACLGSFRFRARFTLSRTLPAVVTAGQKFTYRVRIENNLPTKQSGLLFEERITTRCPSYEALMNAREPGEKKRNWWDQKVRYHRFLWLTARLTKATPTEFAIATIGADSYLDFYAELLPLSRGYLYFSGVTIKRPDPLGLIKTTHDIDQPAKVLVLPQRYPLPPIRLPGTRRHQPGGVNLASSVGNADEFRTLRDYRPGDPIRMLHWKSLAKTGELVIRENEDEFFVRHGLILDTFWQQPYARRFETAVSIAASFACSIRTQESMLDLMFLENKAYRFPAGRGVDHTEKMLEILAEVEPCTTHPITTLEQLILEHAPQLSGCICILLGWDESRQHLVESLQKQNLSSLIIVITDGETPPPAAEHVHFVDASDPHTGVAKL